MTNVQDCLLEVIAKGSGYVIRNCKVGYVEMRMSSSSCASPPMGSSIAPWRAQGNWCTRLRRAI